MRRWKITISQILTIGTSIGKKSYLLPWEVANTTSLTKCPNTYNHRSFWIRTLSCSSATNNQPHHATLSFTFRYLLTIKDINKYRETKNKFSLSSVSSEFFTRISKHRSYYCFYEIRLQSDWKYKYNRN